MKSQIFNRNLKGNHVYTLSILSKSNTKGNIQ